MATERIQIAEETTCQQILQILQNGGGDTEKIVQIKALLENTTYGLSALKTKMNGVDKKSSWIENAVLKTMAEFDYSTQTATDAYSKKNTNIILKEMVQRPNENGDVVYGLESPVGNKNGTDQYVLLCYSNDYSFYANPTSGSVVCRAINDIILSDTKCIRKHISASTSKSYPSSYSYLQELIMLDPLKYGIDMESYVNKSGTNREIMQKIFRDIMTYDSSQMNSDKLSIINRLPVWWYIADPNQLPTSKGTDNYYYSSSKSLFWDYVGMNYASSQAIFTQEMNSSEATSPNYDVRILNAPIISNYFDIKLRTLSSASAKLPSNTGVGTGGRTYANYAVFLKL